MDIYLVCRNEHQGLATLVLRFGRWILKTFSAIREGRRGAINISNVKTAHKARFFHQVLSRYGRVTKVIEMGLLEREWRYLVIYKREEDAVRAMEELPEILPYITTPFMYCLVTHEQLKETIDFFNQETDDGITIKYRDYE